MKTVTNRKLALMAPLALLGAMATNVVCAEELTQVTVTATRPTTQVAGKSTIGADVQVISMSGTVKYSDIDIATRAGAAVLETRVKAAAKAECEELDKHYPLTTPDADRCTKEAVRNAMPGMHAAIDAAEKKAHSK
jgi:UrcA family protein